MPIKRLTISDFLTLHRREQDLLNQLLSLIESHSIPEAISLTRRQIQPRTLIRLALKEPKIHELCQHPSLYSYWINFIKSTKIENRQGYLYHMQPEMNHPFFNQAMGALCFIQYLYLQKQDKIDESLEWSRIGIRYGSWYAGFQLLKAVTMRLMAQDERNDPWDTSTQYNTLLLLQQAPTIAANHLSPGYLLLGMIFKTIGDYVKRMGDTVNASDDFQLYYRLTLEAYYIAQILSPYSETATANAFLGASLQTKRGIFGFGSWQEATEQIKQHANISSPMDHSILFQSSILKSFLALQADVTRQMALLILSILSLAYERPAPPALEDPRSSPLGFLKPPPQASSPKKAMG